jgi:hypothetical protein
MRRCDYFAVTPLRLMLILFSPLDFHLRRFSPSPLRFFAIRQLRCFRRHDAAATPSRQRQRHFLHARFSSPYAAFADFFLSMFLPPIRLIIFSGRHFHFTLLLRYFAFATLPLISTLMMPAPIFATLPCRLRRFRRDIIIAFSDAYFAATPDFHSFSAIEAAAAARFRLRRHFRCFSFSLSPPFRH